MAASMASRFAALKVDDDSDNERKSRPKSAKDNNKPKEKKKNNKRKKAESANDGVSLCSADWKQTN